MVAHACWHRPLPQPPHRSRWIIGSYIDGTTEPVLWGTRYSLPPMMMEPLLEQEDSYMLSYDSFIGLNIFQDYKTPFIPTASFCLELWHCGRDFHLIHSPFCRAMESWVAVEPNAMGLPSTSSPAELGASPPSPCRAQKRYSEVFKRFCPTYSNE